MTDTLFAYPSAPADDDVARLLGLLATDDDNLDEASLICDGIIHVARANGGLVNVNDLRDWLHEPGREPWLTKPQLVGAVVSALARARTIRPAGWTVSTDRRGGNAGKPCRVWRLAGDPR
jgi:hypothetical protein